MTKRFQLAAFCLQAFGSEVSGRKDARLALQALPLLPQFLRRKLRASKELLYTAYTLDIIFTIDHTII